MRRLVALLGVVLALAGTALAAPLALQHWRYDRANATVRDVLLEPLADGRVRMRVLFEISTGEDGRSVTWTSLGGNLCDGRWRAVPDPVLPRREAEAVARALLGDDPQYRPRQRAWYPQGAPEDAVIVSPVAGAPSRRYEAGLLLVFAGLLSLVFARPWAERRDR